MKTYRINDKIVRIGIEVQNEETGELIFTTFCNVDKIAKNILEIERNPYNRIHRTYLADEYGREYEGQKTYGIATQQRG